MVIYRIKQYFDIEDHNIPKYKVTGISEKKKIGSMECPDWEILLYVLYEFRKLYPDGKIEWPRVVVSPYNLDQVIKAFENGWFTLHQEPKSLVAANSLDT